INPKTKMIEIIELINLLLIFINLTK
ncbi:MAG: hypothetical protein UY82_C0004G0021, partial [Candidatus Uhrbacteria bacterium GW2011_GWC2_53_7]